MEESRIPIRFETENLTTQTVKFIEKIAKLNSKPHMVSSWRKEMGDKDVFFFSNCTLKCF